MTYDIHPALVHFPIALLFLYSVVNLLPLQKWFPKVSWKHIEVVLLIVGVVGAIAALSTGEIAEEITQPDKQLVEMHSTFAGIATLLYGLLLSGEVLSFLTTTNIFRLKIPKINAFFIFVQKILTHRIVSFILAALGLIAITITGILGGVIIHGVSADPFAATVLNIFGL